MSDLCGPILGGIIAGLAALSAAFIAKSGVLKSLEAHSERERKAREHEMERETIFQVTEHTAKMVELLSQMGNWSITDSEMRETMKGFATKGSLVGIVGDFRSIAAFNRLVEEIIKATPSLGTKRAEMMNEKLRHDTLTRQLTEVVENLKRARMIGDNHVAVPLTQTLEGIRTRERESFNRLRKLSLDIYTESAEWMQSSVPVRHEAIMAARAMLGFQSESEEVSRNMVETLNRVTQFVLENCKRLRSELDQVPPGGGTPTA